MCEVKQMNGFLATRSAVSYNQVVSKNEGCYSSITNKLLKSEIHDNCPILITMNVHVHKTRCPARRRFTYRRSRPKAVLQASNNNDKDKPTNRNCPKSDTTRIQRTPLSRYSLLKRADKTPPSEPRSVRGWSGALLNDDQSFHLFLIRRMSESLYAKCDVQKKIKNLLIINHLLFHLVLRHHPMFVLYKNTTINNSQQKSRSQLMGGIEVELEWNCKCLK